MRKSSDLVMVMVPKGRKNLKCIPSLEFFWKEEREVGEIQDKIGILIIKVSTTGRFPGIMMVWRF